MMELSSSAITIKPRRRRRDPRAHNIASNICTVALLLSSTVSILDNHNIIPKSGLSLQSTNPIIPTALAQIGQPAGVTGEWPTCIEHNTVIRNAGQSIFTNVQGYGAVSGCFMEDCKNTDKFGVSTLENCLNVCRSVPECNYWSFGIEEGMTKCWMRVSDLGRELDAEGWTSGSRYCVSHETRELIQGNEQCWVEGFDYSTCCDPKFGPQGNMQCWDGMYNFGRCCFPTYEL